MSRNLDTFQRWEKQGLLRERLEIIQDLVSKNVPQRKIALRLGISEKTLQKMKNKHVDFARAFSKGELILKEDLINAIYKKAVGYYEETTQTLIEEVGGRSKRKIVKTKKYYPPDFNSARYLLIIKFGREYHDKKFELEIMEKRIEAREENWNND